MQIGRTRHTCCSFAYIYIENLHCAVRGENRLAKNVKEKLSNIFELPEDIILDMPKIELIGNQHIRVENHKGIIEYTDSCVRLNCQKYMLKVSGEGLVIHSMSAEEIVLSGEILGVEFVK